ncbi:MAG: diheme cytochrome c [Burkholderiaceae bacterium]|nr:diheme cytochrome c [Burkholderiaceae bacterium]
MIAVRSLAFVALSLLALTAHADRRAMPADVPGIYATECGACHVAYAPGALPADSWRRIVAGLERHYGTDASLDDASVARIGEWLQRHAGTWKHVREAPPQDRITRAAWFERKHRKIDSAAWRHEGVNSAANCAACHLGAERGHFDDDDLRIPPGLPVRLRGAWND